MSMLPRPWYVRGVDVEPLCRGVLKEMTRRHSKQLEPADFEESLGFLLGEVVVLDRRYDSTRGGTFTGYLYDRLRFRLQDYWRSTDGRHGEKRVHPDGDLGPDRVGEAAGGDPADRTDADRWLHSEGDRGGARAEAGPGVGAREGVAPGDRGAGARAGSVGGAARGPWADCRCGVRNFVQPPNGRPDWHLEALCAGCGAPLDVRDGAGGRVSDPAAADASPPCLARREGRGEVAA
jgi:hypothetical protein